MSIRNILPCGQPDKDPYFKNVSLLLSGDSSTNGGQNNTFLDSSSNTFAITRNGNVTQGSFSPFGDRWSNYFNGSTDYFQIANSSAFNLSGGAYTIECFIYPTGNYSNYNTFIAKRSGNTTAWEVYLRITTGVLSFYNGTNYESSVTPVANTWSHVAAVYDGTSIKLYLNGTNVLSATIGNVDQNVPITIGVVSGVGEYFNGYISNLRIIKGTALYTSNFTPPTSPLTAVSGTVLLTCQSNRFIDNSTYVNAITVNGTPSVQKFSPFSPVSEYNVSVDGGSAYFDGSGDYLVASTVPSLTGDFTVEYWWYPIETGSNYDLKFGSATYNSMNWFGVNGTSWQLQLDSGSNLIFGTWVAQKSAWNHIALVRSGSTITLYQNGVSIGSVSSSISMVFNGGLSVGGYSSTWIGQKCNMSNFRMIKGTALYTSNFTPPTSPLTNVPNTQLLCNFTNGNIIDSSLNNDLETVGNAQISTSVRKWGTGSMYFDGNGDWLTIPSSNNFAFGTGNFTIEAWIYPTAYTTYNYIFCVNISGSVVFYVTGNTLKIRTFYGTDILSSSTLPALNTWTHVAATRNGTLLQIFVNGFNTASTSDTTNFPQGGVIVGSDDTGIAPWNGYIDDLRITKGIARYTANFTPPTAPLPKQ